MSRELANAFCANMQTNMEQCVQKIKHCVHQLTDEQVWWRPTEEMNSIGNLLLHICGNMTQWIVQGVPQKTDTRNRPQEFKERGPIAKETLLQQLDATVADVIAVLANLNDDDLLQLRRIQGFEETMLYAIAHSTHHLAGHTQELIYITRLQLGDAYQFAWKPRTKEEGVEKG